ncbi:DUF5008 domain-containing protein [Sphingobacterium sp. SGG-5]|uniref:DUF5008 domain-containing protein n=1 Tax=Sphingobacterium sp. SGG-5 TaxID=2710881 RepID=UPI0013EC23C9|nr:DUF5008 domain-containing protein [Sphingobacterium sp. SGG-5]NGM62157.1 DUF5008 domain-containing protein [Sphingobacterium sp. SGG-5]
MNKIYIGMTAALLLIMGSCKDNEVLGPDPYAGGKEPLGIRFAETAPSPSAGRTGTSMTFTVYGAKEYEDKMQFLVNGVEAEVTEVTDSTLTAILPDNVSTGGTRLVIDGQIYPGPLCEILGNVIIDPTFNAGVGANSTIATIKRLSNGQIFLGGSFTDYNGAAAATTINGLARITANGQYVSSMKFGIGARGGSVNSIHELSGSKLLISGSIPEYNGKDLVNHITKINLDGSLDTVQVDILNLTSDPERSKLWVPTFNGGTNLSVMKTFVHNNKVTALGAFTHYNDYYYERSTYDNRLMGAYPVGGIVRLNMDGSLDDTFNVNHTLPTEQGQEFPPATKGLDGIVNDGFMQSDGKLIVVGFFNRYNDVPVKGNIARVNHTDGSVDNTFNPGNGANDAIYTITSTPSGKYLLTGFFTSYDGHSSNGIVRVNADGSVDNSFVSRGFSGGLPNYIKELSNGKILVSGSFKRYDNVIREGLCILEQDGSLAEGYNNTGKLDGFVMDALEGTNTQGQKTITLVGFISRFNGKSNIGNIVRLAFIE